MTSTTADKSLRNIAARFRQRGFSSEDLSAQYTPVRLEDTSSEAVARRARVSREATSDPDIFRHPQFRFDHDFAVFQCDADGSYLWVTPIRMRAQNRAAADTRYFAYPPAMMLRNVRLREHVDHWVVRHEPHDLLPGMPLSTLIADYVSAPRAKPGRKPTVRPAPAAEDDDPQIQLAVQASLSDAADDGDDDTGVEQAVRASLADDSDDTPVVVVADFYSSVASILPQGNDPCSVAELAARFGLQLARDPQAGMDRLAATCNDDDAPRTEAFDSRAASADQCLDGLVNFSQSQSLGNLLAFPLSLAARAAAAALEAARQSSDARAAAGERALADALRLVSEQGDLIGQLQSQLTRVRAADRPPKRVADEPTEPPRKRESRFVLHL